MKVRLRSKEHLDAVLCEVLRRAGVSSEDDERAFAMFRRIVRENVEFEGGREEERHLEALAEKEEARDQRVIEAAFRRLSLVRQCRERYGEECEYVGREVGRIAKWFGRDEEFELASRRHEDEEFRDLRSIVSSLAERVPRVAARVCKGGKTLEDECRRSIGVGDAHAGGPLRIYFDTR